MCNTNPSVFDNCPYVLESNPYALEKNPYVLENKPYRRGEVVVGCAGVETQAMWDYMISGFTPTSVYMLIVLFGLGSHFVGFVPRGL